MKKWIVASLLILSRLSIAATDVLEIGIAEEFESLNPLIATQAAAKYSLYMATRPMVILTPDLKWKAIGIKEIPSLENKLVKKKGEGLEINFEIIPTAQWGDGAPLTCKDIELSWKVGKSNNVSIGNREAYETISSITADKANPKKCTLVLSKVKFDYFNYIPSPLPSHLEAAVFEKHSSKPEGYDQNTLYTKQPTNPGLYYGPYVISEIKLGSHITLTPNPKWLGKKPNFKRIVVKLIPSNGVLEANIRSTNINMISSAGGLSIDQAVILDKKNKIRELAIRSAFRRGCCLRSHRSEYGYTYFSGCKGAQGTCLWF